MVCIPVRQLAKWYQHGPIDASGEVVYCIPGAQIVAAAKLRGPIQQANNYSTILFKKIIAFKNPCCSLRLSAARELSVTVGLRSQSCRLELGCLIYSIDVVVLLCLSVSGLGMVLVGK